MKHRWKPRWAKPSFTAVLTIASYVLAAVILLGGIAALVSSVVSERARADGNQEVINSLRERVAAKDDDLASILESYTSLYETCEAAEGCVSEEPAPEVIERVLPVEGPQGDPGRAPTSDEIDQAVIRYCLLLAQCRGDVGAAGTDGAAGQSGTDGTAGAQGPQGETGETGATGAPGAQGEPGSPGQPPLFWTYTDVLGMEHTCTRTDPFDPANPTYSCN